MTRLGEFTPEGRAEYERIMAARRPGETVQAAQNRLAGRCSAVAENASTGTKYRCRRGVHDDPHHEGVYVNGKPVIWDDDGTTGGTVVIANRSTTNRPKETS